jgi:hypothetical protein
LLGFDQNSKKVPALDGPATKSGEKTFEKTASRLVASAREAC